jgi:3-phosphoshikimate 1-carboxyvinyltransferase
MLAGWQQVGLTLQHDTERREVVIEGCGGDVPLKDAQIFVGNSGTTIRFLTAALAACGGRYSLDGVPRMRERPIADLLTTLEQLGARATSINSSRPDCPPVLVESRGLLGGRATIAGNISSQYLSGLMMAAPLASRDVELVVEGELVSKPYVEMTVAVMRAFGAQVVGSCHGPLTISSAAKYTGTSYGIEPDASAASYFWGAAAICGGRASVLGLSRSSLQGDVGFCDVLQQMGCKVDYRSDRIEVECGTLRGIDVDMAHISDTVQTLAAVALFAEGPTRVRGVAHNRVKETDRIADLATELRRLGADIIEYDDGLQITPPTAILPAEIETYDDHRMAMSLALVGLRAAGVVVKNPQCTAKTYPGYWEDLQLFSGCRIERLD